MKKYIVFGFLLVYCGALFGMYNTSQNCPNNFEIVNITGQPIELIDGRKFHLFQNKTPPHSAPFVVSHKDSNFPELNVKERSCSLNDVHSVLPLLASRSLETYFGYDKGSDDDLEFEDDVDLFSLNLDKKKDG